MKCPQCGGDETYPLLMSIEKPKALCANDFHRKWLDFALHPSLWRLIKRMWEGW